ncbi:acid phosphatase type 7 isoform X1 [Cervus canadensis]|uniref:acid phosphatase type 7 isoform X1 n=1 Tax=Cervus canadensis TaxID=1574408 RepID=UPI001CA308CC|nr:acid phosphatase type 7 isoform X1 [Cervus canadensis]
MCSIRPCWTCCCLLLFFSLEVQGSPKPPSAAPEQVHLSYPGEPGSMTVTWTTWVPVPSEVQYGLQPSGPLPFQARGTFSPFVDGGILQRKLYMHRVTLRGLLPGVQYVYRCGSAQGWSRRFRFRALKKGPHWSPRLAVFGDLGADNPRALPRLRRDTQQGMYDAVLHVGDFAYNMDQDNARVGDRFMKLIEPVAASLPYMTCPGNHEERYNFSNYKARFSMPGNTEGLWYSWDLGPAHIISFSTEVYFFLHYGRHLVERQFHWLESDLQKANKNRAVRPWIITMGHRPMYCSNADLDDCTWHESKVRKGLRGKFYGLEDLFYKYGVDLQLWAHEHSYERLWPIYNYQVLNGSQEMPYTHPRGPVHIITGSAQGCEELLTPFTLFPRPWSALRVKEYGYTRLHILNGTHVHIQQVSDDQDGKIVDDVWVQVAPATFSDRPSVPMRGLAPTAQEELASVVRASVSQSATELSWKRASVNTPNCQLGQLTNLGAHGPAVFLPLKISPSLCFPSTFCAVSRYLLSACYVPGPVLHAVNSTEMSALMELKFYPGCQIASTINK